MHASISISQSNRIKVIMWTSTCHPLQWLNYEFSVRVLSSEILKYMYLFTHFFLSIRWHFGNYLRSSYKRSSHLPLPSPLPFPPVSNNMLVVMAMCCAYVERDSTGLVVEGSGDELSCDTSRGSWDRKVRGRV